MQWNLRKYWRFLKNLIIEYYFTLEVTTPETTEIWTHICTCHNFFPFVLCKYFFYQFVAYCVCFKSGLALPKLSFSLHSLPFWCCRTTAASHHSTVDDVPESGCWSSIWLGLVEGLPPIYDVWFSCCCSSCSYGFSSIICLHKEANGMDFGLGSFELLAYGSEKSRLDNFEEINFPPHKQDLSRLLVKYPTTHSPLTHTPEPRSNPQPSVMWEIG